MAVKRSSTPGWNTIKELFKGQSNTKFVIPVYQRNYVWDTRNQVKKLLDDFYNLIANNKNSNHFLGIIIDYNAGKVDKTEKYYVIDGQQRLTTLFLIIAAIRQRTIDENDQENKFELEMCMNVNYNPMAKNRNFKLEPLMGDRDVFNKILLGQYEKLTDDEKGSKVAQAYVYILNFVKNTVANYSVTELIDALDRFLIVEVPLDRDDNAQQIFETINARGEKLLATDLIRNYVLMCIDDEKKDDIFVDSWQPFEAKFEDAKELESFFRFFCMNQLRDFVKKNDVYEEFRRWLDDTIKARDVEDAIDYLSTYADMYNLVYKEPLSNFKNEKMWKCLKDFRNIKSEMPAPLMIEIMHLYKENEITMEQFIDITSIVNSFIIRRAIIGMDTSGISRFFSTVLRPIMSLVDDDYSNIVDVVRFVIVDDNINKGSRMPTNEELKKALDMLNVYDFKDALHCIFDKYENEKLTYPSETMGYQIEHIMPQKGEKWFDIVKIYEPEYTQQVNRLGNLTLTTKHDNPQMLNNLFDYKKAILKDTAQFRLNVDIYNKPDWNKNEINSRNEKLINELLRLYPYDLSEDGVVYSEQLVKNRNLPKMDKLIEWGIVNIDDELVLGRYRETSKAKLIDQDTVLFNGENLKISQWISKLYGISNGLNSYREIFPISSEYSLDQLRKDYIKDNPDAVVEVDGKGETEFRNILALKIKQYLKNREENKKDIINVSSANTYIRFAGKKMRSKIGEKGDGSWSKITDLVAYEISNTLIDGVSITILIGPSSDQEIRQKWHNFATNNPVFGGRYRVMKRKWDPMMKGIKLSEARENYNSDEEYFSAVLTNLEIWFNNNFEIFESEIEKAPFDLTNEIYQYKNVEENDEYDYDWNFRKSLQIVKDIFAKISEECGKLANFDISYTKVYVAFRTKGMYIFDVEVYKSKLRISFNIEQAYLNDPQNKTRDITNIGTHGNGKCDVSISTLEEVPYLIDLIKQTLIYNLK